MRPTLIVLAAALGVADAANKILIPSGSLYKRQGEAFDPGEETRPGADCVDAFGPGYVECRPESDTENRLCINPDKGETCCNHQWGCPTDSFCLVNDLCCPTGLDPKTCAAQNNVSLPPDFGATTSSPAKTSTTPASSTGPDTTSIPQSSSSSKNTPTIGSTSTRNTTTSASASTTTAPTGGVGNNTTTRTASTSKPAVTAGASQERAGAVAALFGLVAAMVL